MKAALVPLAMLLTGCGVRTEKQIVAWPGMSPAEFNRLNGKTGAHLKLDGLDWIGVNSPLVFEFRQGKDKIEFEGTRSGGGLQVLSSGAYDATRHAEGPPHVTTISFNVGGGLEDYAAKRLELVRDCAQLSRMAGTTAEHLPTAEELAQRLWSQKGLPAFVTVCGGEGERFTFQIEAWRPVNDTPVSRDDAHAWLDGTLIEPLPGEI